MWIFRDPHYDRLAGQLRKTYRKAEPFPHVVIDDFLPVDVCDRILAEFPRAGQADWRTYDKHGKKLALWEDQLLGAATRDFLGQLAGPACLEFLESLTGISGLIPDPYLEGGGLHQIERGGYLQIHADFNMHRKLRLDRRVNLIVYLNKNWREEYGGHLELWDRTMSHRVQRILPIYNRCVVFDTLTWGYHGHPEALTCPPETSRKSLAVFYYSQGRPADEKTEAHATLWQKRPGERALANGLFGRLLRRWSRKKDHALS